MKIAIYLPLAVLLLLSVMSVLGLGTETFGTMNIGGDTSTVLYYDSNGNPKCYANLTAYNEAGTIVNIHGVAGWVNETGIFTTYYTLYWDNTGTTNDNHIHYQDVGFAFPSAGSGLGELSFSSSLGFVALIIGLMALAVIVGLRVLGSGTSETSVSMVIFGTAYLALWGVFSVASLALLSNLDVGGYLLYFVLSLVYVFGILSSAKGGED